ncbi:MAG: nucleotidyl transferase AbiEii/AbiGii toxin family protein [Burkholderiales bacterium]|nr:nucleotidyl transferase AbiEii/AbiGii toxin family protein [Burkholderiales bacterium]
MTANRAASIRARLKQHADTTKQDFNLVLTRYGLERLLYRLSISEHAPNFLLKGALLFQLWYGDEHRPTRDADLLGFGPDDVPTLVAVFRSVSGIAVNDGIAFDLDSISGAQIRKDASYGGVRIDLRATLDRARIALQVDIGFGDAVTPQPQPIDYPTLLADVPAPKLRAYPKATVVAEKLHAVSILGMTNSRMKDFFDLWVLLRDQTLQGGEVQQAIEATFARRQTALPDPLPVGLSDAFANDGAKQLQWRAFLRRNRLDALGLAAVLLEIRTRLQAWGFPGP